MKKIIVSASIAFAAIAMVQAAGTSEHTANVTPLKQQYVQDTVPRQRRDSSWKNKRKYPDTMQQRQRRDTVKVK